MNNEVLISLLEKINREPDNNAIEKLLELSQNNMDICHIALRKINTLKYKKYYQQLWKILEKFAQQENELALIDVGVVYQKGLLGIQEDLQKSLSYFEKAMNLYHSGIACQSLGAIYYFGTQTQKDLKKAYHYFEQGAKYRYADCEVSLGEMYLNGEFVEKNYMMASYWYEKAFYDNRTDTALMLGNLYNPENNLLNDSEQALEWYCKGALNNDKDCCVLAGTIYEEFGEKFYQEAFKYYEKSAQLNSPIGSFLTALSLYEGKIVTKNTFLAKKYFQKALQLGYEEAQYYLNILNDVSETALKTDTFSSANVDLNTTTFTGYQKIQDDYHTKQQENKEKNEKRLKAAAAATGMSGYMDASYGFIQDKDGNELYVSGDFIIPKNGDILEYNQDMNSVYNPKTGQITCLSDLGNSVYNWNTGKVTYVNGSVVETFDNE